MKSKRKVGVLALAAVMGIGAILNHELIRIIFHNLYSPAVKLDTSTEWKGGDSYEHLHYSDISESDYLNLYVPRSSEPMPLIILVHGGGFVANDCESRQAQFMYRYFREQSYACASVNYRLAQEAAFPAAVEDVKAAVRFLRANAGKYGYLPDKFAIWGESAGGYLAVMAGVTTDEEFQGVPFIGEEKQGEKVSGEVQAVLDFYGIIDFEKQSEDFRKLGIPGAVVDIAGLWIKDALKGYEEYDSVEALWMRSNMSSLSPEEKNTCNPSYYITKNLSNASPLHTLIWHGDADLTVPYLQSERLAGQLKAVIGEDKVSYRVFPNYKHAADGFYGDEVLGELKAYLDEIFL